MSPALLSRHELLARLRAEGEARYHDHHPFHVRMHAGELSRAQIQGWTLNRYYYQTRIPIKDALILSKSEDSAFRRRWIRRIHDHDGVEDGEGGLALWLRLAEGVGLDVAEVKSCARVLPAVRFACDGYVQLVRERSLVEAVASSLTEFFAPDIMTRRLAAWEKHYPWVDPGVQEYFRSRVPRARADSGDALDFVVEHATTRELQERCLSAFVTKCDVLWCLLDAVSAGLPVTGARPRLARKVRLKYDAIEKGFLLLYPERGMKLTGSAAEILQRCDGERTEEMIAAELAHASGAPLAIVRQDVATFLGEMKKRGLVEVV